MKINLCEGEYVRHKARAEWGTGKITSVNSSGTISVTFEENRMVSIAKGTNFLIRVDKQGKKI